MKSLLFFGISASIISVSTGCGPAPCGYWELFAAQEPAKLLDSSIRSIGLSNETLCDLNRFDEATQALYTSIQNMAECEHEPSQQHPTWTASRTQLLFIKAFIAALTSGFGGFPLFLLHELPAHIIGSSIIFAAGLMSGCSMVLFIEALEFESSIFWVVIYALFGMSAIHLISHFIGDLEDFEFAGLKGQSASKALLIVLSMGLHSLGEGISVGVSATGERGETVGLLVIISLAIHNIPEGIAVSLLLMSQGMNVWTSSVFAIISNIPQPMIAIPAFIFLESFQFLLPIGYGVASGAMTYIVCTELIPEAKDKISRSSLWSIFVVSSAFIVAISVFV